MPVKAGMVAGQKPSQVHTGSPFPADSLAKFREHAARLVSDSPKVAVLADFLADRFNARAPLLGLINGGNLPHAAMLLGKGLLDETGQCPKGWGESAQSKPT
jgi:indolepyruvate decarboxylase